MPYDAAGNFTRAYNWTADKLAGIKIESERMDGEFDNFAAGMNQVLLRNGSIPWGGDLKLGGNKITGLGNGTEASPAIQFLADTTTGIFLPSAGSLGLSALGQERLRVNNTSVAIAGGHLRVHSTSLANARMSIYGDETASTVFFNNTGGYSYLQYGIADFKLSYVVNSVAKMTIDANGLMTLSGGISVPASSIDGASIKDASLGMRHWHPDAWFTLRNNSVFSINEGNSFAGAAERWRVAKTGGEAAGNVGNDFYINSFDNGGNYLNTPLLIRRSDAQLVIKGLNAQDIFANSLSTTASIASKDAFYLFAPTSMRWAMFRADAEAAGNVGSDFAINAYGNAGEYLNTPLRIRRSDGYFTIQYHGAVGGGFTVTNNLVCKSGIYADGSMSSPGFAHHIGATFSPRWYTAIDGAEAAGNGGSNYRVARYDNAGGYLGEGLSIRRSDAFVTFAGGFLTYGYATSEQAFASKGGFIHNAANSQVRWHWGTQGTDGAGNTGYDLGLFAYDNNGAFLRQTMTIERGNGNVRFSSNVTAQVAAVRESLVFNDLNTNGPRANLGLTGGEAAGNVGNDWYLNLYDNGGAYLVTAVTVKRSDKSFNLSAGTTLVSPVSCGNGYVAPYAINLIGSQPAISFNENNLGTKCVLGAVAGGGIPKFHMSRGNNTGLPFEFNIATGVGLAAAWTPTSDVRLKSNIQPLVAGLDVFAALNPVTYKQATNEDDAAAGIGFFSAGIIAQDLIGTPFEGLVVLPEDNGAGGMSPYAFNYTALTAWYIAAFKETRTRLNTERTRLTNARNRINALESQLADVLARLDAGGL